MTTSSPPAAPTSSPLRGLRVLVTGASRGLGRGLTVSLLRQGATVLALARSSADLQALAAAMEQEARQTPSGQHGALLPQAGSMLDALVLEEACRQLQEQAGGLDLLIANAGVYGPHCPFQDADPAAWEEAFLVNTLGLSRSCRACVPALAASGRGQILVVGSAIGHTHGQHCSAYATSKAMSWSLVKCLSTDLAPLGIAVNELIPGPVNTAMNPGASTQPACREPDDPAFLELLNFLWNLPGKTPSGQSFSLRTVP